MSVYERLLELPLPLLFVLSIATVALVAALALGVARVARSVWPVTANVEMAGGMLAGLLVPLGFILASVSGDVWSQRDHAKAAVDREALALTEVRSLIGSMENAVYRTAIGDALGVYAGSVVRDDWPAMRVGLGSARSEAALRDLQETWFRANRGNAGAPPDGYELNEMGKRLEDAASARHTRLLLAREHVHPVKLLALLLMMFSTCYVIVELNRKSRREMVNALALFSFSFGTLLFLIVAFDRPFAGVISTASPLSAAVPAAVPTVVPSAVPAVSPGTAR
ncbi:bestrophin-like domain [Chitinasiproducens palmae]|uniref:DUF4239 domain-containing protein n=1 Tax=Chitinasiproducens palmae TaxID=1770053 RepID=A0A1H2PNM0_9BURK|nr:DUF4239 domain-containing protein [Chitinasiproducens palmae]SDV47776.1 Protein of unknown function [Chitinasiproducens palmae]